MSEITDEDLDNLRHMLGMIKRPKRNHGYRNHFVAGPVDIGSMNRLVAAGYAKRGSIPTDSGPWFYATEAGCKAVGLHKAGIERAMWVPDRVAKTEGGE